MSGESSGASFGRIRAASPKARRLASERGLDIAQIVGSGPHGEVLTADVLATGDGVGKAALLGQGEAEPSPQPMPMSTAWRIMAERTTQSWTTAPHFFLMREVRASAFVEWLGRAQQHAASKLTYTDLLVKVMATALRQHPRLNASWRDNAIVPNDQIHIGIAVAVSDGLLVPVIQNADDLSLNAIARQRTDLVARAQAGKLRPDDLQGGTFTISNLGMYGVDAFTAIINAP